MKFVKPTTCSLHCTQNETIKRLQFIGESGWEGTEEEFPALRHGLCSVNRLAIENESHRLTIFIEHTQSVQPAGEVPFFN
jgi:hypothetical protein